MSILKQFFSSNKKKPKTYSEGDVFYICLDNKYYTYKLLFFEIAANCYHVLSYDPIMNPPKEEDISNLEIMSYHAPIDKNGFENDVYITNIPVTSTDITGYHEYLKQTKNPEAYIPIAKQYYKEGLHLTDKKKLHLAIDSYSKAFDLFPPFFEAVDNRAFCKMDLGLWLEAIEDFKLSIEMNTNSFLTDYSIGECYFKNGDLENAKEYFESALKIDPSYTGTKKYLNNISEKLNS